jgi:hypothetical protein
MSLDQLMLWRFRNIEGVLDNIQSWNMVECKFEDGSTITYDYTNNMVTIDSKKNIFAMQPVTVSLSACTKEAMISEYGFVERTTNRHNLSYGIQEEVS